MTHNSEVATATKISLAIARGWSREDVEEWIRISRDYAIQCLPIIVDVMDRMIKDATN